MTKLVCLAFLAGCGSDSITAVSVTTQQDFSADTRGIAWMWGTATDVADVGATLIASYDRPLTGRGFVIDVPENPHELIDQGFGPVSADRAEFYFDVFIDLDGDGMLCPDDLRQNFDDTPFETYATAPETLSVVMELIPTSETCRSIVP